MLLVSFNFWYNPNASNATLGYVASSLLIFSLFFLHLCSLLLLTYHPFSLPKTSNMKVPLLFLVLIVFKFHMYESFQDVSLCQLICYLLLALIFNNIETLFKVYFCIKPILIICRTSFFFGILLTSCSWQEG